MKINLFFIFIFGILLKCNRPNKIISQPELEYLNYILSSNTPQISQDEIRKAEFIYHNHNLFKALDIYNNLSCVVNDITEYNFINLRLNWIFRQLHDEYGYKLFKSQFRLKLKSTNSIIDSIIFVLNDINNLNKFNKGIIAELNFKVTNNKSIPHYFKALWYYLLGDYFQYIIDDERQSKQNYKNAYDYYKTLNFATFEFNNLSYELIQKSTEHRETLKGLNYGKECYEYSLKHFSNDVILLSNSLSHLAFIESINENKNLDYNSLYSEAIDLISPAHHYKQIQNILYFQSYSSFLNSDSIKTFKVLKTLEDILTLSDTFVNISKLKAHINYNKRQFSLCIKNCNLALNYIKNIDKISPAVELTTRDLLSYSYKELNNFAMSNKMILLNLAKNSSINNATVSKILNSTFDQGFFNFTLISELASNYYHSYLKNGIINNLKLSSKLIDKCSSILNTENYSINDEEKIEILNQGFKIYDLGIQINYELFQKFKDSNYIESLFYFQEKSKGNLLLSGMTSDFISNNSLNRLLNEEKLIQGRIQDYRIKNYKGAELIDAYDKYDSIEFVIKNQYQDYFHVRTASGVVSKNKMRLPDSCIFVSYSLIDNYLYSIRLGDKVVIDKVSFTKQDMGLMDSLISYQNNSNCNQDISEYLLNYFRNKLSLNNFINSKYLIVCPDKKIFELNFQIFFKVHQTKPKEKIVNVFHTISASTMKIEGLKVIQGKKSVMFCFSNLETIKNPNMSLPELPYSFRDIEDNDKNILVFSGLKATKEEFIKYYTDTSIDHIQISTHAFSFDDLRDNNFIIFRTKNIHKLDTLFGYQLGKYKTKLSAITLAFCQAGNGKYVNGEGYFNLIRYFKLTGIKRIDASFSYLKDNFCKDKLYKFI